MQTTIPLRTVSESNQREHWTRRARRAKAQRSETYRHLRAAWCMSPQAPYPVYRPLVVVLTRIAPRDLDAGNLEASLKAVQDGVADWLAGEYGQGQDRQPGLFWRYGQQRGRSQEYAILVRLVRLVRFQPDEPPLADMDSVTALAAIQAYDKETADGPQD